MLLNNFTILYVEDEKILRKTVSVAFKGIFKKVLLAKDGKEGFSLFKKNQNNIDIIVTDINMPKLNGLDMCEKIRKVNQQIPIIITTAHKENDFLYKAIEIGISKFVIKPINMNILFNDIKKLLEPIVLKHQLIQEEKKHLEKMVENEKFSATGKLAAGIIHEINTPLTFIKANAEIMKLDIKECENKPLIENLNKSLLEINDGVNRIINIVNSMKEVSCKKDTKFEKIDIFSTIITATTLVWNKFKHISNLYINGKKFDINLKIEEQKKYFANIQKQRIEQVWIIIINNALDELIKIANFNDRRIDITLDEDEQYIITRFKDNAGGIEDNILKELFEPFKGTKDSSGMGVGLSIAKKIISEHNGACINAYNKDSGAVFEVKIIKL